MPLFRHDFAADTPPCHYFSSPLFTPPLFFIFIAFAMPLLPMPFSMITPLRLVIFTPLSLFHIAFIDFRFPLSPMPLSLCRYAIIFLCFSLSPYFDDAASPLSLC